jgi:hypothetical protein
MADWMELVARRNYAAAEAPMLAETDRGEGFFPLNEVRASFYEDWADALAGGERIAKYKLALMNWEMWAACSTSGGEGTARMSEVHRVEEKLERLNVDR